MRVILGLYRDNGKEKGNYYNGLYKVYRLILRVYWDNGRENGNYCNSIGYIMGIYIVLVTTTATVARRTRMMTRPSLNANNRYNEHEGERERARDIETHSETRM